MAPYEIVPAHPPLPTAWNFPFHPDSGSQTSTLMSESLEGASAASTRQNAGRLRNAWPMAAGGLGVAAGGVNAPGSTMRASVIVACGRAIDARLSHAAAASSVRPPIAEARKIAHSPPRKIFIASPVE